MSFHCSFPNGTIDEFLVFLGQLRGQRKYTFSRIQSRETHTFSRIILTASTIFLFKKDARPQLQLRQGRATYYTLNYIELMLTT